VKKLYNKLVRDRIPEVIAGAGKNYQVRHVSPEELKDYSFKKLREEIDEFIENPCAEEAADIMEIMSFICHRMGIREYSILAERTAKRVERGAFEMGFILEWVEE